ncbi:MAG TPA: D-glycero-beta-D-manno-heptose 1-phosphate adenylyltransferase [Candidatus Hydrogenedentes bacterium]|nr:D-glycero-beta-D-manno-heptose 1-phosphate adenylyltransferase [Candidatus Hydrogenedentota bacterium]
MSYTDLVSRFKQARVMVVGDIYLDENVYGAVTSVSLEAPIPVYEVHERRHNPGAAGNAACNVASLGATTYMLGYVGDDVNAGIVRHEFAVRNVNTDFVVTDPSRPTNTYGKLRAGGFNIPSQEILRTDTPSPAFISGAIEDQLVANIEKLAPEVDTIVVVDQVSSVATERVLATAVACAKKHKLLTVGDSRSRAGALKGFDVVVPNDREAGIGAGIDVVDEASLEAAATKLLKVAKNALITRGPQGIRVCRPNQKPVDVPITISPDAVVDVTGAGDTVTAAVALTLVAGGSLEDAAVLGNAAAGVAVVQPGVVTVSNDELRDALTASGAPSKLKTVDTLQRILEGLRREGKRIVWTNGCFDIIHVGHITYLQRAAALGDVLVVGLNSDVSVKMNKGPDRPIIHQGNRAIVLAAFECVDYIVLFDEPTPMKQLEILRPDIYAKGGDYSLDTIVQEERRLVEAYGGEIAIIPGVEGHSTTQIIRQMGGK